MTVVQTTATKSIFFIKILHIHRSEPNATWSLHPRGRLQIRFQYLFALCSDSHRSCSLCCAAGEMGPCRSVSLHSGCFLESQCRLRILITVQVGPSAPRHLISHLVIGFYSKCALRITSGVCKQQKGLPQPCTSCRYISLSALNTAF